MRKNKRKYYYTVRVGITGTCKNPEDIIKRRCDGHGTDLWSGDEDFEWCYDHFAPALKNYKKLMKLHSKNTTFVSLERISK